jgi:peptidyl-prolyl cis-trans isomerase C
MMSPLSLEDQKMNLLPGSGRAGMLAVGMLVIAASASVASAETVMTVNGHDIDSTVIDLYIFSRTQKPANQVSGAEREQLVTEITDIYLLTTQDGVEELMQAPEVEAQMEIQKRGLMAQVVAMSFLESNVATDEEILSAYAEQIELEPPLQFKARHILVETQAAAIDLVSQLDAGGDFQELAKANSTGPSGPQGGDLGWFSPSQMVEPFSDAVAELADGDYTKEPVQTQFGWHVILREESRASEPPTLESVRDVIKQNIEQQKLQDYLMELRALEDQ